MSAGVSAPHFVDIDGDGALDLYVANYLRFALSDNIECIEPSGLRGYCNPESYDSDVDALYRNLGDGTFEDISEVSGIQSQALNGLGVKVADFNHDQRLDLYVANDMNPNLLWINQGEGRFEDQALLAGCAVNAQGRAEGSMGIAWGDVDLDGQSDMLLTHVDLESHTLYRGPR